MCTLWCSTLSKPTPPHVPTDKLDQALVKVLGHAMRSLRDKDIILQQRTG